jgi:hypothetical protein
MSINKENDVGNSSGDMAVIGEGTPNRTPISIQVLQNIYHELTGKSEEVSKSYDDAFHVALNDFKQLHLRIQQTCEQYQIKAGNISVSVFYINDTKDTFSSFDRFEQFNAGSTSAVESVLLTYNFLIVLPKISQPQSYTVTIRVANPVAIQRKMNDDMFSVPKIFKLMGGPRTAVVNVKYVDYAVARAMLNTIDEWFNGLPKSQSGWLWKFVRKHTDYIPLITKYAAGFTVATIFACNVSSFLPTTATIRDLAQFSILAFATTFAAYKISYHLGSAAEDSIDSWVDIAYISITDGDKRELKLAEARNKKNLFFAGVKLLGGLLVSVAAKLIAYKLIGIS